MNQYILKDRIPVSEPDIMTWARMFEFGERTVGRTKLGDSEISTVFLGMDHSLDGDEPILWETMVFGGELDQRQTRCSGSWEDAEKMHERMVLRVKELS